MNLNEQSAPQTSSMINKRKRRKKKKQQTIKLNKRKASETQAVAQLTGLNFTRLGESIQFFTVFHNSFCFSIDNTIVVHHSSAIDKMSAIVRASDEQSICRFATGTAF